MSERRWRESAIRKRKKNEVRYKNREGREDEDETSVMS